MQSILCIQKNGLVKKQSSTDFDIGFKMNFWKHVSAYKLYYIKPQIG